MRRSITFGIITLAAIVFFGAADGNAQTGKGLVAEVPFDFYVKGELMAAGKYEFVTATSTYDNAPLIVRPVSGPEKKAVASAATIGDKARTGNEPLIIFRRYGSENYLSAVHDSTANISLRLIQSKRERQLVKARREGKEISIKPVRS